MGTILNDNTLPSGPLHPTNCFCRLRENAVSLFQINRVYYVMFFQERFSRGGKKNPWVSRCNQTWKLHLYLNNERLFHSRIIKAAFRFARYYCKWIKIQILRFFRSLIFLNSICNMQCDYTIWRRLKHPATSAMNMKENMLSASRREQRKSDFTLFFTSEWPHFSDGPQKVLKNIIICPSSHAQSLAL